MPSETHQEGDRGDIWRPELKWDGRVGASDQGGVELEEAGALKAGDAVRLTEAGARRLTADSKSGAEVLVWEAAHDLVY